MYNKPKFWDNYIITQNYVSCIWCLYLITKNIFIYKWNFYYIRKKKKKIFTTTQHICNMCACVSIYMHSVYKFCPLESNPVLTPPLNWQCILLFTTLRRLNFQIQYISFPTKKFRAKRCQRRPYYLLYSRVSHYIRVK